MADVTDTGLFVACVNLRWPETGNQDKAMRTVLRHPKIRRKIEFEANKLSGLNPELDKDELREDIKTLLYLAIRNEFNTNLDPNRMEGWLCSRIAWRSLDHIAKECDLIYAEDETGERGYSRREKISIDTDKAASKELNKQHIDGTMDSSFAVSFGDMVRAGEERHQTFESFLRKARIKASHKHVLMYVIAMDYSFKELADVYGVSSPTARKIYNRAVMALKRYVLSLTPSERTSVHNLLTGVYERS